MNQVILIGRLTRDPEVRYTGDQMAVASFTVAIDRVTRADKEKQTDFPRVVTFGKQAELCERYLAKGRLVAVQGRIQTGSYKNKEGATVYTTDVVAERVEFLEWGDRQGKAADAATQGGARFGRQSFDAPPAASPYGGGFSEPSLPEGFSALDDDDIPF
ncbi:MAG: single-stranded DNA-binding protein [Clostridiales Family XIII bacterium]|jgi:single-strand DNA-binding protein|nr:single-stranded DNA-binding protein [Clostridiales Family XIII bacterium]